MIFALKNDIFGVKKFFYMHYDLKNGCKNEFQGHNEKSCSRSRNRVSHKIDFKVIWTRNSHAARVGVNFSKKSYDADYYTEHVD